MYDALVAAEKIACPFILTILWNDHRVDLRRGRDMDV
jgi:hypothetical protein